MTSSPPPVCIDARSRPRRLRTQAIPDAARHALPTPRPLPRLAGSGARIGAARQPHRYGHRRGLTQRQPGREARRQPSSRRTLDRQLPPRPPSLFRVPVWQPRRLPRRLPRTVLRAHSRGACMRTPYRLRNRPATRRCGLILHGARVAGLAGRCPPQAWWQPPRIRPGTVTAARLPQWRFVGQRTVRHVAGSLRTGCARRRFPVPCAAAAPLRVERLPHALPRAYRPAAASQPHRDRHRLPHGVTG